jgi:hypothetical protein
MERRLYILIIILVYFIACGKSCVDDTELLAREEKKAEMARDSIRQEFETGYLSEEARFAAEITAIQKLKDFSDYLKIYTDVSVDTLFREKAGDMIKRMFVSSESQLSIGPVKNNKMKATTVGMFIEKGFGEDILRSEVVFNSIRISEPLQKSGDENYKGKLVAYQSVILLNTTDSIISPVIPVSINFISSRKNKIIGQDTLKVWEVSLGNFETTSKK